MKRKEFNKEQKIWILIGILFVLGLFFKFALIGYSVLAFTFIMTAVIIAAYKWLRWLKPKREKLSKTLNKILTYCLLLFLMAFAITEGAVISDAGGDEDPSGKYVIVLGAGVNGTEPSYSLKTRLNKAYDYLTENPESICIVSGGMGAGEEITEAECMRIYLEEKGIEPSRIIKEEAAKNTKENLANSVEIISENGGDTDDGVVIITSEYHIMRSKFIASKNGVDADAIPAITKLPFLKVNYFIREVFSMWKLIVFG